MGDEVRVARTGADYLAEFHLDHSGMGREEFAMLWLISGQGDVRVALDAWDRARETFVERNTPPNTETPVGGRMNDE